MLYGSVSSVEDHISP